MALRSHAVMRFHFDIREDGTFVPDPVGATLPTVEAVIVEAVAGAVAIANDRLPGSKLQSVVVEARDENGSRVLTATVSLKIELVRAYVMPAGED
jgi:hypothetical protein